MTDISPELLRFFKALADGNRLKIVGLLARQSHTREQLAALLDLRPVTLAHHLARLTEAGLVGDGTEGQQARPRYTLRFDRLHALARQLLADESPAAVAEEPDLDDYERKVLKDFSRRDGSLKEIPLQERKLLAVLRHMMKAFEPERRYSEKEVNAILAHYHPDTASLRRAMVDYGLMQRTSTGRTYWLVVPT